MEGAEWNGSAVGPNKRHLSEALIKRLRLRFAPGGLLHYGQGKWYPGESLPRWALGCYWRLDGVPVWENADLIANVDWHYGYGVEHARRFAKQLARELGISSTRIRPAYEDVGYYLWKEGRLPAEVDPRNSKVKDPEERDRLRRVFEKGLDQPVGFVMPLRRQWWQSQARWTSGEWPFRGEHLMLLPGDSPLGLRLPLDSLPATFSAVANDFYPADPWTPFGPLPPRRPQSSLMVDANGEPRELPTNAQIPLVSEATDEEEFVADDQSPMPVRTALCVESRDGRLHIFMPPVERLEDYLDLVEAIERTAAALQWPVVVEGYPPPHDPRMADFKVTPDPGVIEVNIQPTSSWDEVGLGHRGTYGRRLGRLGSAREKFDLDGRHTGTGGGNHVVLGGRTPADSPFLRRPDLLKSLVAYWNNHPSLSYLFSSKFIGPTSQAPRMDEGRRDAIYEMQLAFAQIPPRDQVCPPWLVDRVFRNLLTDLTGNTHRAEFCIDKLFSPDSSSGRLGLLDCGFEMPPHHRMSMAQMLLIRALVVAFWERPYDQPLMEWGTSLHDRYLLPYPVWADFGQVIDDLIDRGIAIEQRWFEPHFRVSLSLYRARSNNAT
ncbi:MAG: transglutaminase family protein [Pirellulaceae bacterium]